MAIARISKLNSKSGSAATVVALALIVLLGGCLPEYFPRREIKRKVSEQEVVGEWHLTQESAAMLREYHVDVDSTDSKVTLLDGGRCILGNFVCEEERLSGNCTWILAHDVSQGRGPARVNEVRIVIASGSTSGICRLNLSLAHGHLVLWQYESDPDGRKYVEYVREPPER